VWQRLTSVLTQGIEFEPVEIERDCPFIGRRVFLPDARPLCREGSAMLLLMFKDITEQKKAQEAVLHRTAQFRTLLNEAPMVVGGQLAQVLYCL
jgi:PAS domain-containing protein